MMILILAILIACGPELIVTTIDDDRRGESVAFHLEDSSDSLLKDLSQWKASENS
jgi:hypothetical protein